MALEFGGVKKTDQAFSIRARKKTMPFAPRALPEAASPSNRSLRSLQLILSQHERHARDQRAGQSMEQFLPNTPISHRS